MDARRPMPPSDPALAEQVATQLAGIVVDVSSAQGTADDAYQEALARRPNIGQFSEDGTWSKPDGSFVVFVRLRGSGATGEAFAMFLPAELGATETVTVATGSGGLHTTSFGAHLSVVGVAGAAGHALITTL